MMMMLFMCLPWTCAVRLCTSIYIPQTKPAEFPAVLPTCLCVRPCLNHLQVLVLPQFSWVLDFYFLYFIRNVVAVTFSADSPQCALLGPAPNESHLLKSKRSRSCFCLSISLLSYLTQTEGHRSTFPPPLAKGHYVLYETWNSITALKDLQTNSFFKENPVLKLFVVSLVGFSFVLCSYFSCRAYNLFKELPQSMFAIRKENLLLEAIFWKS